MGNTILVAQPAPELIAAELPPAEIQQSQNIDVLCAGGATEHCPTMLQKKEGIGHGQAMVFGLRAGPDRGCPLFAHTPINANAAEERLPQAGITHGIEQDSVHLDSIEHSHPTLSEPASMAAPFCAQDEQDEADDVRGAPSSAPTPEDRIDAGCCRALGALVAEDNANAEFLVGLDGAPDDDALGKLAVLRAKIDVAQEPGNRTHKAWGDAGGGVGA